MCACATVTCTCAYICVNITHVTSAFINRYILRVRVTSWLALRHISSHISTGCVHKTLLNSASLNLRRYTNVVIIIITIILLLL